MEQDVDNAFKHLCCACLSSDRNLIPINSITDITQVFELIMYDFSDSRVLHSVPDLKQSICWECQAIMKRFAKFKRQVHNAQEHLRVVTLRNSLEAVDHSYLSQSLSSLESVIKLDYDKMYIDYSDDVAQKDEWPQQYIALTEDLKGQEFDVAQNLGENITLDIGRQVLEIPDIVVHNPVTGEMSHIVVRESILADSYIEDVEVNKPLPELKTDACNTVIENQNQETVYLPEDEKYKLKSGYITEYMSEAAMLEQREEAKKKVQYASSVYKCELCIIGFYTQQQVEDHFLNAHRAKAGHEACKVCYVYVEAERLRAHVDAHYLRRVCRLCGHAEPGAQLMARHVQAHLRPPPPPALISVDAAYAGRKSSKKKQKNEEITQPKPGDLRKLLSKTTIVGYKCLECDMFFKTSRARKNHVARYHREGLQCDHCKKRFVNRTTLATHLRLHEGPLPREECPVCHKLVRVVQLKYHVRRHQSAQRYECRDCRKHFSHLATYQAHLKYSRAHASDHVFKFPCPMCNKGYPTKQAMQDHFNYQHLGKTTHKCPICNKPIASKANVEKHMMRIHGEKKEKPRNHVCQQCGKAFTDKKALGQHAVIHSGERPLTCDICLQTFKQKASLYTHRKRVHKVIPSKRVVEFMEVKTEA